MLGWCYGGKMAEVDRWDVWIQFLPICHSEGMKELVFSIVPH